MFPHDVTIAVVSYNGLAEHLPRSVSTALAVGCPVDQLLVIDVASTDATAAWMAETYPEIRCITLEENRGPNRGRNRALNEANTPFVVVMDVDTQLQEGVVQTLRAQFDDDPRIAVVSPVVVYPDEPEMIHQALTWVNYLCEATATHNDESVESLGNAPYDVGSVSGCSPMIRRAAAARAGMYDERMFFGKTDGEFCYRVTMAGYRIVVTPQATVLHHHLKRGSKFFDHQVANHWYFMLKNYQLRTLILCLPALLIHESALFTFLLVKGKIMAWFKGMGRLLGMIGELPEARASSRAIRCVGDGYLLRGDHLLLPVKTSKLPLPVAMLLRAYIALACLYWSIISCLLRPITTNQPARVDTPKQATGSTT